MKIFIPEQLNVEENFHLLKFQSRNFPNFLDYYFSLSVHLVSKQWISISLVGDRLDNTANFLTVLLLDPLARE